mmetsp:Transcript_18929/g.47274  ORF Transcript_18929/g.47274 Transcript_18929/m.47274 type:complete len:229 (-) Transcript_18929:75-761(-)
MGWDVLSAQRRALARAREVFSRDEENCRKNKSPSSTSRKSDSNSHRDFTVWNFAIGSNLSPGCMLGRGISPRSRKRGVLKDWSLVFNHSTSGYASVLPCASCGPEYAICSDENQLQPLVPAHPKEIHGVLWELSQEDFLTLVSQEFYYEVEAVTIEIYPEDRPGDFQDALVFRTTTQSTVAAAPNTKPSARYINLIVDGAREVGLDDSYCRWLEAIRGAVVGRRSRTR